MVATGPQTTTNSTVSGAVRNTLPGKDLLLIGILLLREYKTGVYLSIQSTTEYPLTISPTFQ